MKFKAHQSFFIRKGWLSKGMRAVKSNPELLMPSHSKNAMDELGLGANQVVALRYWLQAMDLVRPKGKSKREQELTELGELIVENDPYTEEYGTLWALHCNLASAIEVAAAWYFFFNEFNMTTFNRDDFVRLLQKYVFANNGKKDVALTSLDADFTCILSTYIPHDRTGSKASSPESVIDCPLGDLGLIETDDKAGKTFRKLPPLPSKLPSLLVLYAIRAMCERSEELSGRAELRLETLLDAPSSPGRLFNLDSIALLSKLYELENDGYLRIVRTAGLDVVRLNDSLPHKEDCLARYYEIIG